MALTIAVVVGSNGRLAEADRLATRPTAAGKTEWSVFRDRSFGIEISYRQSTGCARLP